MDDNLPNKINEVLEQNANLFVWSAVDMLGIDPNFIYHKLSIFL